MSVQYQLTDDLDTSVDAELFVVDLFDVSAQQVAELHAKGRVVIAYVSVGSLEGYRDDTASFPAAAIGMPLADYPKESWIDIRNTAARTAMQARFDRARSKGFDGVYASTLGAYSQTTGFPLTRADQLAYDEFLANALHTRKLSAGLSGDFELGAALASSFDWALALGCIAQKDCDKLATFKSQHKPMFDLETEGERDTVCMEAQTSGIPTTLKHSAFDAWRVPCS